MKTSTAQDTVIERDGIGSDGAFQIQFNAKMARILSDGLYSNKIQAIIRELSCNAIDSHVEAGCVDKPIEVHLPTVFEPWFYVRDFGVGLDHQQVLNIYTVYGASTKTNSNEFIGQLGLGSKSPFSYVDAFDVCARKNGVERQYSMYKNEQGMPSVALLGEVPTTEPNGVTVKMPVRADDVRRFSTEAAAVFRWFETQPTITGATGLTVPATEYVYIGTRWGIRKYEGYGMDTRALAVMGRVAYPLDSRALDKLGAAELAILGMPVVINFEIGDLEVAASREGLGYDPRTQENIRSAVSRIIAELGKQFETEIADAPTEWEARARWGKIFTHSNPYRSNLERAFGNAGLQWQGTLIREPHVTLKPADLWDNEAEPQLWRSYTHYKTVRQDRYPSPITIRCDSNPLIVFNDLDRGSLGRVNWALRGAPGREIYMIGESPLKTREEIVALLGNPPWVLASSLPRKPAARAERVKMLRWRGGYRAKVQSENWETVDCDLEDGGIYVMMERYNVQWGTRTVDLQGYINKACELGIIPSGTKIYSPRAEMRKKVEAHPLWTNLFALIKREVEARLTPKVLQAIADNTEYQRVIGYNRDTTLWQYPLVINNTGGVFARFVKGMREIESIIASNKNLNLLVEVASEFGVAVNLPEPSVGVFADIQQVYVTYPMIAMVMDKYSTRNINGSNAVRYQDYINMVDAYSEQMLQQNVKNLVAA